MRRRVAQLAFVPIARSCCILVSAPHRGVCVAQGQPRVNDRPHYSSVDGAHLYYSIRFKKQCAVPPTPRPAQPKPHAPRSPASADVHVHVTGGGGAMVARLTPVQKVASSILVRPTIFILFVSFFSLSQPLQL